MPYLFASIFASFSIAQSRMEGVWNRSLLAGVKVTEIVLANVIQCAFVSIIMAAQMILGLYALTDIEVIGNMWMVVYMIVACTFNGYLLGFFISILTESFLVINGLISAQAFYGVMITGVIW